MATNNIIFLQYSTNKLQFYETSEKGKQNNQKTKQKNKTKQNRTINTFMKEMNRGIANVDRILL